MKYGYVGIFFYVEKEFRFFQIPVSYGEQYGDFVIYSYGHQQVWDKYYYTKCGLDYDYYPRGRIVYHNIKQLFYVYYDVCLEEKIAKWRSEPEFHRYRFCLDEHYQCHQCNQQYII